MQRRDVLQLTGTAFVTAVGSGCLATDKSPSQGQSDPIEFDDPGELLLEPALLPGDGWNQRERSEPDILDVQATFVREFTEGEQVDGDEGSNWIVVSAVGGRDDEAAAADLYGAVADDLTATVGDARVMDLELADEAAIAGYDGVSTAIFRDVNCVARVSFTDCTTLTGPCYSDVSRAESLARTQRESWRGQGANTETETEAPDTTGSGEEQAQSDLTFEGEGTQATDSFGLERGLLAVAYDHDGGENFIVNLVDTAGEERDYLLANEIGSVSGRTITGVDGGEYVLDVDADGVWQVELTQPRPNATDAEQLPVTIDGAGSDYAGPFTFEGLVRASGRHTGESNFIVEARDGNGDLAGGLVFNEVGEFAGETTFTQDGLGWLVIDADGEWSIDLEHE